MKYDESCWTLTIGFYKSNEKSNKLLSSTFIFIHFIAYKKILQLNELQDFFIVFPCLSSDLGGAAGNRTLVQTRNQYAFYMLSFLLVFDDGTEKSTQAIAYPLEISPFVKGGLRLTLH